MCWMMLIMTILSALSSVARGASVKDYGAKGDGQADDTAAIQKAQREAGGPVELPAGRYGLSGSLKIPSGGGLYGVGTLYQSADRPIVTTDAAETSPSSILIEAPLPGSSYPASHTGT